MNNRGFIKLPVIIAIALGLGFGASAYLNYVQYQRTTQDEKLMQGQITDLRYQINQDHLAATSPTPSDTPTPTPAPTPSPSPSATPAVLDANTTAKTTTVKKSGNIHLGPSTSSKVVLSYTRLPVGTTVTLGSVSGSFQQITVNGVTGYILASYLN